MTDMQMGLVAGFCSGVLCMLSLFLLAWMPYFTS